MSILHHLLALLSAYSGLGIGILLAKISPEELKEGEKYFLFLRTAFIVLIAAMFLFLFRQKFMIGLAIVIALCSLRWPDTRMIFGGYGLYLAASAASQYFPVIASLVLLAGIPEGTLFMHQNKRPTAILLIRKYWPLLLSLLGIYHFTSWMPR